MKFLGTLVFIIAPLFAQQVTPDKPVTLPLEIKPSAAIDPNKVVLQIGDIKITAQQLDNMIDVYPANTQVYLRGPGKQQFAETLVRTLVLAAEARNRKLDESEKYQQQIAFSEANLLAGNLTKLINDEIKGDDPALRKYYDEHRCEYQVWHAHHLLVRTAGSPTPIQPGAKDPTDAEALARAQEMRKRLAGGADIAELARAESDDAVSGANGGDLGEIRHGQVVPSLEEAICSLTTGQISQPVKSVFGYHVVKLDTKQVTEFEKVKGELDLRMRPEAAKKTIDDLIAKTKVVKDPDYYGDQTKKP